jgi:hypothetical protein
VLPGTTISSCLLLDCDTQRDVHVVSFVIPILESLAVRCALPSLCYLREVTKDGSVLAGVELELPFDGAGAAEEVLLECGLVWLFGSV